MNEPRFAFYRLLALTLVGSILGAAFQLQQRELWSVAAYACFFASFWALTFYYYGFVAIKKGAPRSVALSTFFLCAAIALGFGATGLRATAFQVRALSPALEGRDVFVTGVVTAMPSRTEDALRFVLNVESAQLDGQPVALPQKLYLGWYAGFARRQTHSDLADPQWGLARQPQRLVAGDRWNMTVRLKAPHGASNPHGFDFELWLWEQGIGATGYVRAGANDAAPVRVSSSWAHPIERARGHVREAIFARVSERAVAGVIAALVTGDQDAIERADWDVFRATGVAHLMSISGLHITMFAWVASLLLGWLWRNSVGLTPALCLAVPASRVGAYGGVLLALLYALFSGWGLPAQRTLCMLATVVFLKQSGKQWPWPHVWLLAMGVVVAFDPWALLSAGFWLSFVAVGVLFASDPSAADKTPDDLEPVTWRQRFFGRLGNLVREQWVVTVALTPLSLLLFNQVSVVGLLANVVAIGWVTLVVTPLAMLGVVWAPLWSLAALAVQALMALLQNLASWPFATISMAQPPLWAALFGVAGGLLLAMRLPWRWRALALPLVLPVFMWQPQRPAAGQFELIAADVGQGNALLVRTAQHTLVYDTGPRFSRESDAGQRVLVPLLRALGERVDTVVVSHRDADHSGGAPAVLAMQPQAVLLSSIADDFALQQVRRATRCVAGQRWRWDGVDFEVLHPQASDYERQQKPNAVSCVLRVSNGAKTALLVADIERAQEALLVRTAPSQLKADVLLVPHHGSKTSSSPEFLDAVQPAWGLVQAGYRNRFGHPAPSVIERYTERKIQVVNTASCGAATWSSATPENMLCDRDQARRYWHHVLP